MKIRQVLLFLVAVLLFVPMPVKAEQVNLYAAGSLRAALSDVAKAFEAATGNSVATEFGPSGLLRQRIEQGEEAFASLTG
ncbi:substrate-binding domain-containing protein [Desulfonatronum parangueonense]